MRDFTNTFFLILLMTMSIGIQAQDIHFTHFRMAPLSVNPAMTGSFQGTYRISAIYRDQWRSVGNAKPYKTPFLSAEVNIASGLLLENDWVAGGMSFLSDQSGSLNMKHQLTGLNVGYHLGLDKKYLNVISIGLTYGSGTRGFDKNFLSAIKTPNSLINGQTGETFTTEPSKTFTDMIIGLTYKTETETGSILRFGLTAAHVNSPDVSLYTQSASGPNPIPNPGTEKREPLSMRTTFFTEASFLMAEKLRINPAIIFQNKSSFSELAIQGTADYLLNQQKMMTVTGGLGYRLGDAVELIGGIQIKDLRIALSYDLTVSNFTQAGGGAFELAVGYVGRIFKNPDVKPVIFCPRL